MKMTDNEIIKALACCVKDDEGASGCSEKCPLFDTHTDCATFLRKNALDLINRQKAEIEELQQKNSSCNSKNSELKAEVKRLKAEADCADGYADALEAKAKAEAIKEFAKRLKEKASSAVTSCQGREIYETKQYQMSAVGLDNLVKEMVGDDNA